MWDRLLTDCHVATMDPAIPGAFGAIRDGAVGIQDGRIVRVGRRIDLAGYRARQVEPLGGAWVTPGLIDCHTHLVFAGNRAGEFEQRLEGASYEDIARAGGGILSSVKGVRLASLEQLVDEARPRLRGLMRGGVTTVEIKSGYGLDVDDEARLLSLAGELTDDVTFLGGHVVAPEFAGKADEYVDLVRGPMLDACAPLARWADVFCERGAFDEDQSRAILTAARDRGLGLRIHTNQLEPGPGARLAAELGAASADHLTHLGPGDAEALASAGVVATLVPVADLSTRSPWPDARELLDAGATVALATDCNPGTSFTTNMPVVIALAVTAMRMTPAEAVWSATAGSARALQRFDVGTLQQGARADLVILDAPSHVHLAYRPGVPIVRTVISAGTVVCG
jgi:imidazolonepropionase